MHDPNHRIHLVSRRPHRCFHHRVWMASCDDCRRAHSELLAAARRPPTTPDEQG